MERVKLSEKDSKKQTTWSKTVESGAFIRTTYRKGNKRKTKTKKFTKNEKKVILARLGEYELYCYPFDYPDTVFLGKYPVSIQLDSFNIGGLFTCYNRARWFLNGEWQNEHQQTKQAKNARQSIVSAYNRALNEKRTKK